MTPNPVIAATFKLGEPQFRQVEEMAEMLGLPVEEAFKQAMSMAWRYAEVYSRGGRVLFEDQNGNFGEISFNEVSL